MGNVKKRTPNPWIHELTPTNSRIALGLQRKQWWYRVAGYSAVAPTCGYFELEISYLSRTRDLSHKPEKVSKVNSQNAVSLGQVNSPENIEHNSRWTYLSEILIFGLDSRSVSFLADSLFQAQRTTNIHFRPGENHGENCLRSDDDLIPRQLDWAQLRRDWLVIKRAPFWILSLLECDSHLHKFIILYWFFWMFFRKGVVRGCIIDDDTNCVSFSHSCVNKGQVFLSLLCEMPQESLFSRCWSDYVSTSVWLFPNATALH